MQIVWCGDEMQFVASFPVLILQYGLPQGEWDILVYFLGGGLNPGEKCMKQRGRKFVLLPHDSLFKQWGGLILGEYNFDIFMGCWRVKGTIYQFC